jgi:hypothetical protein
VIEYYLATTKQLRPSVDHTVPALAIGQARLISDQWQTDRSLSDPLLAHNGLLERALHMSALGGKVDPSFAARAAIDPKQTYVLGGRCEMAT